MCLLFIHFCSLHLHMLVLNYMDTTSDQLSGYGNHFIDVVLMSEIGGIQKRRLSMSSPHSLFCLTVSFCLCQPFYWGNKVVQCWWWACIKQFICPNGGCHCAFFCEEHLLFAITAFLSWFSYLSLHCCWFSTPAIYSRGVSIAAVGEGGMHCTLFKDATRMESQEDGIWDLSLDSFCCFVLCSSSITICNKLVAACTDVPECIHAHTNCTALQENLHECVGRLMYCLLYWGFWHYYLSHSCSYILPSANGTLPLILVIVCGLPQLVLLLSVTYETTIYETTIMS